MPHIYWIYLATFAAAAVSFPLWGYALHRIDLLIQLTDRQQWYAVVAASAVGGALVAAVPTIIAAVAR